MDAVKLVIVVAQLLRELINYLHNQDCQKVEQIKRVAELKDELRRVRVDDGKDTAKIERKFGDVLRGK